MAGSLSAMGEAFASLSKQRPAKRDARSGNLDPLNGETKKPRIDAGDAVETGGDSDDSDVIELLATNAENDSEGAKTQDSCNNEGEDDLLKKLALDVSKDDKVSSPISKQLADIINKRWASKLSENKVKETVEKYDRPENCEKLVAPKVNPEIWGKLTHHGKKQDLRLSAIQNMIVRVGAIIAQSTQKLMDFRGQSTQGGKLDTGALVTAQIDAIALLGHTNYELSFRRREAIKPNLNKEYGSLCSSQTWWPVLMRMLVDNPVLLPKRKKLLFLPSSPEKIHPLYPKLELLMCHLSGDHLKAKEFRQKLPESLCSPGDRAPQPSTKLTTRSGNHSAVDGKLIPFRPLYRMA